MPASTGTDRWVPSLPRGTPQPGAGRTVVDDAVELEVEQLAEAQAGAWEHDESAAGEGVLELVDGAHQRGVVVGNQRARQRPLETGDGGGEHELVAGLFGPAPQGDVVEEVADREQGGVRDGGRDRLAARDPAASEAGGVVAQERLDVASVELAQ